MIFILILLFATLLVVLVSVGLAMKASTTQPKKPDHPAEHPTEDKKGGDKTDPHKKDGHEDDHNHHHAHPEGFALLWSGVKKEPWFPILVLVLAVFLLGKSYLLFWGPEKNPTPPKVEYAVDADILGTGLLSRYSVTSYGPTFCRFDSVYNDGLFFAFDPRTGEGTCGYYGGGKPAGKIKVTSHTEPTPLSFLVLLQRQKEGAPEEWEDVKIEGKGTLKKL